MKKKLLPICAFVALTLFFSCKKDQVGETGGENGEEQDTIPASQLNMLDVPFLQLTATGSYKVIAGKLDASAQVDGNGNNARFLSPGGVFVNPDGSFLVADLDGDVRKVQHDTVVTTLIFPIDPDGFEFAGGSDVAATTDGSIAVVAEQEYWLYSQGVLRYHGAGGHNEIGLGVDRDPSGKFFWYTDFTSMLAVMPNGAIVPTKPLYSDQLGGFNALSASNNGVKYFASDREVYKYTKSGVSARIFSAFTFTGIRSIASSRDGYKIYIADGGDIKMISNNPQYPQTIKTILSGGNVIGIALSNSEKYLYFTSRNTLNKLKL